MGHENTYYRFAASPTPKQSERAASGLETRGPGVKPLVFFPPFLTGEMEAAGRHPPGALRPEVGKSPDHP